MRGSATARGRICRVSLSLVGECVFFFFFVREEGKRDALIVWRGQRCGKANKKMAEELAITRRSPRTDIEPRRSEFAQSERRSRHV